MLTVSPYTNGKLSMDLIKLCTYFKVSASHDRDKQASAFSLSHNFDWCCFGYFVRNSLVVLLEVLSAQMKHIQKHKVRTLTRRRLSKRLLLPIYQALFCWLPSQSSSWAWLCLCTIVKAGNITSNNWKDRTQRNTMRSKHESYYSTSKPSLFWVLALIFDIGANSAGTGTSSATAPEAGALSRAALETGLLPLQPMVRWLWSDWVRDRMFIESMWTTNERCTEFAGPVDQKKPRKGPRWVSFKL